MLCLLLLLSNFNICQLINKVIGLASDKGPLSQSHAVWLCLVPSELVQYCNVVSLGTLVRLSLEHGWTHLMKYLQLSFLLSYLGSSALIFQMDPARWSPLSFDDSIVTRRDDLNSTYIYIYNSKILENVNHELSYKTVGNQALLFPLYLWGNYIYVGKHENKNNLITSTLFSRVYKI